MVLGISHSMSIFITRFWWISIRNQEYHITILLDNTGGRSWCPNAKYHFLYPKCSITPSIWKKVKVEVDPKKCYIYIKNAIFSYHWCLRNVRAFFLSRFFHFCDIVHPFRSLAHKGLLIHSMSVNCQPCCTPTFSVPPHPTQKLMKALLSILFSVFISV